MNNDALAVAAAGVLALPFASILIAAAASRALGTRRIDWRAAAGALCHLAWLAPQAVHFSQEAAGVRGFLNDDPGEWLLLFGPATHVLQAAGWVLIALALRRAWRDGERLPHEGPA